MAGGTIMVVDDDRAVLRSLERILIADGYDVVCRSSAHEALQSIPQDPPDAILLDLMMPAMNGRQFLTALREELGRSDIPVLVITGVRGIDVKQAMSMGASDVIEKPFELDELLNKIALLLFRSQRKGRRSRRVTTDPGHNLGDGDGAGIVLLISTDAELGRRIDATVRGEGHRLVTLVRASVELPRVTRALGARAVLVDLDLPQNGALAAVRLLRSKRASRGLPVLLLARAEEDALAVSDELAKLGATTLVQPFEDQDVAAFLNAATPPTRRQSS